MGTGGTPYTNPLRPRVTIKTVDGEDTLYTFNAFNSNNDIGINQLTMENAMGENGSFTMSINDHNNEIAKDRLHNVKVFLELGKTTTSFQHFLIGYSDLFQVDRTQPNAQFYNLSGFGSRLWSYQLFIDRREKYRRTESDAKIYNIIDNALTKRLWRPLKKNDESIEDITGWSPEGISTKVNTVFTVIDKQFVYFGDLCDELCDVDGAVWFIDISTGSEIFTLTRTPDLMTKIIIKSGDMADRTNDDPDRTAYHHETFSLIDDTTTDAGTATRLYTLSISDSVPIIDIGPTAGATDLNNRTIGQQVIIDNDARRIESITVSLSKQGEPESPNSRVNGFICLDKSNKPNLDNILDEFHIDLGSIKHNPEKINVPVDISARKLDVAQSKIWVVMEDRSGITGDPTNDPANTVRWHHNNIFNTAQAYYSGFATAKENRDDLVFTTTNNGPLYRLIINSNIRRLISRSNKKAADRIRLREQLVDSGFLEDPPDIMRYISLNLSKTSKGRRSISDIRVTVPNNFLFRPYQICTFDDGLSDISDVLQVQRASYSCLSQGGDDSPLGTFFASITLGGSYNTLIGDCSCL